ncbi:MAG TPA: hydroxysqualene dehydroxylase HpnE [Alphaproteobacteria bacterium]|nr:hydroxysqualene dehydroxylase HpnE [Alphaproteobacteria bacterium]
MTIHVIGAGLSGLAAAVALTKQGLKVVVYEAAAQAGGRCRSYRDRELGRVIDNGNHMVLSGNGNVREYLKIVGAEHELVEPAGEGFRFLDLTRNRAFTVRPNQGPIPWWIAVRGRNVPDTTLGQYFAAAKLAFAPASASVADVLPHDELYRILWEPLAVSALNTPVDQASAQGFWRVLVKTLARGGRFSRPLIARETLGQTFIEPGLDFIAKHGGRLELGTRIKQLAFAGDRVIGLSTDAGDKPWEAGDQVIVATPPAVAERLTPRLEAPGADEPIVNAHFATDDPEGMQPEVVAVVGGAAQWVFRRPGLASVTVSAARAMVDVPAETLAPLLWADVIRAFPALGPKMPPYRIVKEKRATIRQSPTEEAIRPGVETKFKNLWLAGDWTRTGLPATIEGSLLSGFRAAKAALKG